MATVIHEPGVGPMLRGWREQRRLSQLELALDTGISARHLSFVETGRSNPSAEMVLRLAEQLQVPFRERNELLLAAGFAPAFPERSFEEPDLVPVREALDLILAGHEPYPGLVVDRGWNVVAGNSTAGVALDWIAPELLEGPLNAMRIGLHPKGLAPHILNLAEVRAYFLSRLRRQVAVTGDPALAELLKEVSAFPGGEATVGSDPGPAGILGPIRLRVPDSDVKLSFFSMVATFGTPIEVTTSELVIELAFPADPATAQLLENLPPR